MTLASHGVSPPPHGGVNGPLVDGFAATLGTNCWVVAPGRGEQCVVIDPGIDAAQPLEHLLARHRLQPVAVLLTHGHFDHTYSVVPVCGARDIPAYIHPNDRGQLRKPVGQATGSSSLPFLRDHVFTEPEDVRELGDGQTIELGPLTLRVSLAPGHTPGSVTFGLDADAHHPGELFTGDLLFAGAVGRTDLPGGDYLQLLASLTRVCDPLDDSTALRPGHGATSTLGREREVNGYLAEASALRSTAR